MPCPAPIAVLWAQDDIRGNEVPSLESVCQARKGGLRVPGDFREAASRPFHLFVYLFNLTYCISVLFLRV